MPPTPGPTATTAPEAGTFTSASAGGRHLLTSAVAALGVVFGDLATSPLYTLKECVHAERGVPPSATNVYGVLSLIFWALTLVVTVKYLYFLMRVDNDGEGGILALLALAPDRPSAARRVGGVAVLGLVGAALLYGDGIITPTVSVLSALEGLADWTPRLRSWTVPLTCAILLALFAVQHRGTGAMGRFFGPVMVLWLVTIGLLGGWHVARHPQILAALAPTHAIRFFAHNGWHGFLVLGSVVMAVTGCEALYADMGHFGARPIRRAWLLLAFPALVLCYFGQGAVMLADPQRAAMENSFYALVPQGSPALLPLVVLATAATVIASQALVAGVFSLTYQAVQLGLFPRVRIRHTSETRGQIYVPVVNWLLAAACITMTVTFGSSSRLAAAFGLAVSGTMFVTSLVYYVVVRRVHGWSRARAGAVLLLFMVFDLPFVIANLAKIPHGGWVPLLVGALVLGMMLIWTKGRLTLERTLSERLPMGRDEVAACLELAPARVPGVAVFMASRGQALPPALGHFVRRLAVLPETVLVCSVETERQPTVPLASRMQHQDWGGGIHRLVGHHGFLETPNIPALVRLFAQQTGQSIDLTAVSYVVSRETPLKGEGGRMGRLSESLFAFLSRNARLATAAFRIPSEQVIEFGLQVDL